MVAACLAPHTGAGFLSTTIAHLDCQAQTLGSAGYLALANPASPVSITLVTLLTLFVAALGVRTVLGRVPSVSDLTLGGLKLGFVLLLATSWPAYRILTYDIVLRGPAELFGRLGQASGLPGSEGGLVERLQRLDDGILTLIVSGSGRLDLGTRVNATEGLPDGRPAVADDTAFGLARSAFMIGLIGAIGLVRLMGGLLLAVGPLFAGCLLFSATRAFFAGWVRSLVAVGLGSLATSLVLSVELAILEPWLSNVLTTRAERLATPFAPFELMALAVAFLFVQFGMLAACARLSFSSALSTRVGERASGWFDQRSQQAPNPERRLDPIQEAQEAPSRAYLIARSVASLERRQAASNGQLAGTVSPHSERTTEKVRATDGQAAPAPLGQTYQRINRRVSAAATKRSASA